MEMKRKTTFFLHTAGSMGSRVLGGFSSNDDSKFRLFADLATSPTAPFICFLGCFSIRSKGIFPVLIVFVVSRFYSSFCTLIFVVVVLINGQAAWWAWLGFQ